MERRKITLGAALMVVGLSAAPASAQVPSVVVPPLLPTVSACDVSVVDSDSVRVAGVVDPNTLATTFRVEYGLLGGLLNHSSLALDVGSLLGPTTVSTQLDDLVVGGSYGCRLVAVNQAGPVTGSVTNFNVATGSGGSGGSDGTGHESLDYDVGHGGFLPGLARCNHQLGLKTGAEVRDSKVGQPQNSCWIGTWLSLAFRSLNGQWSICPLPRLRMAYRPVPYEAARAHR